MRKRHQPKRSTCEALESRRLLASISPNTTISSNIGVANETDVYDFTATAGQRVVVSMTDVSASGALSPSIAITGPGGAAVISASNAGAAFVEFSAATTGTYKINAKGLSTTTGAYKLRLGRFSATASADPGDGQGGAITTGTTKSGTINDLGDFDVFSFNATAGQRVIVTVSDLSAGGTTDGSLYPSAAVYGPNGALVTSAYNVTDPFIDFAAATSGTYNILVRSVNQSTGAYKLRLGVGGQTNVVADPDDSQGGPIAADTTKSGSINDFGDIDIYQFSATAGQRVVVAMSDLSSGGTTDGKLYPYTAVYGPNGALVTSQYNVTDTFVDFSAATTGVYNILLTGTNNTTGAYKLRLGVMGQTTVNADPDDNQGGTIASGTTKSGSIGDYGDLDVFKFNANAGQRVIATLSDLSAGGTTDGVFYPYLAVYGPNGALVSSQYNVTDPFIDFSAATTGVYNILVAGTNNSTGAYKLRLGVMGQTTVNADPDDNQGGTIQTGTTKSGSVNDYGDIDIFKFNAAAGQRIIVTLSDLSAGGTTDGVFYPYLAVYGPNGALVSSQYNVTDTFIDFAAATGGTYNILLTGTNNSTGAYKLRLGVMGQSTVNKDSDDGQGGALTSATTVSASANDYGDIDLYSFAATAGQRVALTLSDTSAGGTTDGGFYPYLAVYGPTGALVSSQYNVTDPFIEFAAATSGTYNVVVAGTNNSTGAYKLRYAKFGLTSVASDPADGQGGFLASGVAKSASIGDYGDTDVYGFYAAPGDVLNLTMSDAGGLTDYMALYDPTGKLIKTASNSTTAAINYTVVTPGIYGLLTTGTGPTFGAYTVNLVLTPNYVSAKSTISVDVVDPLATEPGSDIGQIKFTRTNNRALPQVVNYTVSGSATKGSDYVTLSGTATIAANAFSTTIDIKALTDALTENAETVIVTLGTGSNYIVVSAKKTGTVTIAASGTGVISGKVYNDVNGNSVIESGDNGQSGRRVFVDLDNDKLWDSNERSVLTDSSGNYNFSNMPVGTFRVRTVVPAGQHVTAPIATDYQDVTLAAGQTASGKNFATSSVFLPTVLRVNAGGGAFTTGGGTAYSADTGFSGGTSNQTAYAVNNTTDDFLYYTRRTGTNFTFSKAIASGTYNLTLNFAEPTFTSSGQRKFDVFAEGKQLLNDFDIVATAGAKNAYSKTFSVSVIDGKIDLSFVGVVGDALISAISLVKV